MSYMLNMLSVTELVKELNNVKSEIENASESLRLLQCKHENLHRRIWKTCDHNWQLDVEQVLGPYDRRDRVCEKCHLRWITPGA